MADPSYFLLLRWIVGLVPTAAVRCVGIDGLRLSQLLDPGPPMIGWIVYGLVVLPLAVLLLAALDT